MDDEQRPRHFSHQFRLIDPTLSTTAPEDMRTAAEARAELERLMVSGEATSAVIALATSIAVYSCSSANIPRQGSHRQRVPAEKAHRRTRNSTAQND